MLVDSSVWIPFLRGDVLTEVDILVDALDRAQPVWLVATILQEVLQGADRPERFASGIESWASCRYWSSPIPAPRHELRLICTPSAAGPE